jgi:hypothetical protein
VAGTLAALVLAAASGASGSATSTGTRCAVPKLAGTVVDVTLADMGGMMGGPMMGGMARVFVSPGVVPAGTVSLRVVNRGWLHPAQLAWAADPLRPPPAPASARRLALGAVG